MDSHRNRSGPGRLPAPGGAPHRYTAPMVTRRSLAVLLLAGCAHAGPSGAVLGDDFKGLLVEPGQCRAPAVPAISRAAAAADLTLAEQVLRRGYAGFDAVARGGFDWDAAFARLRADVAAAPEPIAVEDLRQMVLGALGPTRDSHLALWTVADDGTWRWGACGRHRDAFTADPLLVRDGDAWKVKAPAALAGATLLGCDGRKLEEIVRPSFAGGPAARLVVLDEGQPLDLRCTLRRPDGQSAPELLPLHRFRLGRALREGAAFERSESEGVAVVRLASFGNRYADDLARFIDSAVDLRQAAALVIDARGNHEGSDGYLRTFFTRLTRGPLRGATSETLISEVTLQGQQNRDRCDRAAAADPATIGAAEGRLSASRRALSAAYVAEQRPFRRWTRTTPEESGTAPALFRAPLVVIVDAGCAAACEALVAFARQLPGSLIVGENTAGVAAFGEPLPYRLPRSGLWIQTAMTWLHDAEPARVVAEGEGQLPDVWIDETDPLPTALALSRCLGDSACAAALGRRP